MFNPAVASENIKEEFIDYLISLYPFSDPSLEKKFREQLEKIIAKGPFVDIKDAFQTGATINDIIREADPLLSPLFADLEKKKPLDKDHKKEMPLDRPLFLHQIESIEKTNAGHSIVVSTGTGSGKTFCFLYPIINALLQEKEKGTLQEPGIRAILIYPMNALANDQLRVLRRLLMYYPDITFGAFTGDTDKKEADGASDYETLHGAESAVELTKRLPNELVSREEMIKNPPHILITNYAMLERLLFVPFNDVLFHDSKVRYIVLDESHVYRGATGMETAMLLRRLRARINGGSSDIQYILTSATLSGMATPGSDSKKEIASFATNLTGTPFSSEDVIFGARKHQDFSKVALQTIPAALFCELAAAKEGDYPAIFEKYGQHFDSGKDARENLFDLCYSSRFYQTLRLNYQAPVAINAVGKWLGLSDDETIAFLFVCTRALKNQSPLIDLRYHFFVRALEGAYLSLTDRELFLDRLEEVDHGEIKDRVFEIAVCSNCGDIALVGHTQRANDGTLRLVNEIRTLRYTSDKPEFFHIIRTGTDDDISPDSNDIDFGEDSEDEKTEPSEDEEFKPLTPTAAMKKQDSSSVEEYWLCPHCGALSPTDEGKPECGHGDYIKLRKSKGKDDRCLYCFNGGYKRFYIGYEAATGVLATSLFEQLPTALKEEKGFMGTRIEFEGGKQFLAFSDSRANAAYFATYLERTYKSLLSRRGLVHLLEQMKPRLLDESEAPYTVDDMAVELTNFFKKNHSFISDLAHPEKGAALEIKCQEMAWIVLCDELINSRRSNSLQSFGILQYEYLGNIPAVVEHYQTQYFPNLSCAEVKSLLDELILTFAYFGALKLPNDVVLSEETKKYIFYSTVAKAITGTKTDKEYCACWFPSNRPGKSDEWIKNFRLEIVMRALKTDNARKAYDFLDDYFKNFVTASGNDYGAISIGGDAYEMPTRCFAVRIPGNTSAKWYRCDTCGRLSTFNIGGQCQILKCDGHLHEIDHPEDLGNGNHYVEFYHKDYLQNLLVKEHTAQLSKKMGQDYQISFEKNHINALSCSTTFELGVDVGSLETVFLRDVPPTAANYAQRAGRAGRSRESAAFALTYAKLSSHDFNYYQDPTQLIAGWITPPFFKLDNERIVYRHIFSVCLAYFFKNSPQYFDLMKDNADPFLNQGGYEAFEAMLQAKPASLSDLLARSFGSLLDDEFKISSFEGAWVNELIGPNGRLTKAIEEYRRVLKKFDDIILMLRTKGDSEANKAIGGIQIRKDDYGRKDLIDFLVDANVLPKYGFPVDTVELEVLNGTSDPNSKLRLSRDLSQAISDYAPGEKVIADGAMYRSRYIKKSMKDGNSSFERGYVCQCPNKDCGTMNYSAVDPMKTSVKCVGCGQELGGMKGWLPVIQPVDGMLTDGGKPSTPPLTVPEKVYRSDACYIGQGLASSKFVYCANQKKITLISSLTSQDKIMILSSMEHPFYVCDVCGYSLGFTDTVHKENSHIDAVNTNKLRQGNAMSVHEDKEHLNQYGRPCICHDFHKNLLCHIFDTDIIQILFNGQTDIDESTSYSVLFALIDAISHVLGVERTEISGCLRYNQTEENTNIRFILFDNVPGGAGHVKQLVNHPELLSMAIGFAYQKMDCQHCQTSCYSCLRTYENQKYHDILSHKAAREFLENYLGELTLFDPNSPSAYKIALADPHLGTSTSLQSYDFDYALFLLSKLGTSVSPKALQQMGQLSDIPCPDYFDQAIILPSIVAPLVWLKDKVILLKAEDASHLPELAQDSSWRIFVLDDHFDAQSFAASF